MVHTVLLRVRADAQAQAPGALSKENGRRPAEEGAADT